MNRGAAAREFEEGQGHFPAPVAHRAHAQPEPSPLVPRPQHCLLGVTRKKRRGIKKLQKRQQRDALRHSTLFSLMSFRAPLVEKPGIVGSALEEPVARCPRLDVALHVPATHGSPVYCCQSNLNHPKLQEDRAK